MTPKDIIKYLGKVCIFTLLVNTCGCITDSLPVSKLPETNLLPCNRVSKGELAQYDKCYVDILAEKSKNSTYLNIEKGQEYTFVVHGDQFWHDKTRLNRPLCGESGSFLMNFFLLFKEKKVKDSLWFSLIAEIENENITYDLCPKDGEIKNIGSFIANGAGQLILYANDIEGFYKNNSGIIRLEITRNK